MTDENEEICGESFDHDLERQSDPEDEIQVFWCNNCGAEIFEESEDD